MTNIVRLLAVVVLALSQSGCVAAVAANAVAGGLIAAGMQKVATGTTPFDGLLDGGSSSASAGITVGQKTCLAEKLDKARDRGVVSVSRFRVEATGACFGENTALTAENNACIDKALVEKRWQNRRSDSMVVVEGVLGQCFGQG